MACARCGSSSSAARRSAAPFRAPCAARDCSTRRVPYASARDPRAPRRRWDPTRSLLKYSMPAETLIAREIPVVAPFQIRLIRRRVL
jgi:hypothetical protein